MPSAKNSARAGKTVDALRLLRSQHEEVSALFAEFEKSRSRKEALAEEICAALTAHATIEEEIFYPAVREGVEDAEDLVAEAAVEHQSLKELISKIEAAKGDSEMFEAQVKVLGEYVKHHVKEEQGEMFPKVRESKLDLKALGERMATRHSELTSERAAA